MEENFNAEVEAVLEASLGQQDNTEEETPALETVYNLNNLESLDDVIGLTEATKFHLRSLVHELRQLEVHRGAVPHTLLSIALWEREKK